jgi:hypothetical protein
MKYNTHNKIISIIQKDYLSFESNKKPFGRMVVIVVIDVMVVIDV